MSVGTYLVILLHLLENYVRNFIFKAAIAQVQPSRNLNFFVVNLVAKVVVWFIVEFCHQFGCKSGCLVHC